MPFFFILCSAFFALQSQEVPKLPPASFTVNYRIGPGDVLHIEVLGEKELTGDYKVHADGTILFPLLGSVKVSGFTPVEASERIEALLEKDYFVDAQLNLTIKEYLSQKVSVLGAIKKPGQYYLKGTTTLLDILSEAGGLTEDASNVVIIQRESAVSKATKDVHSLHVNLTELQKGLSEEGNVRLLPGDKIFVKQKEFFYIQGEVGNPGKYEVTEDLTLMKAISLAGGFGKFANQKKIEIHRKSEDGKEIVIPINAKDVLKNKSPDVPIRPSDVIVVKSRRFL